MNATTHWATTVRILTQLRRDRRAMFMILVIPALITVLFYATLSLQGAGPDGRTPYDRLGIFQIAVIPCAVMFPIAAITMRRERASGTLDRLFTTPMSKLDLLAGTDASVFVGMMLSEWGALNLLDFPALTSQRGIGGGHSMVANRVSYHLNLIG